MIIENVKDFMRIKYVSLKTNLQISINLFTYCAGYITTHRNAPDGDEGRKDGLGVFRPPKHSDGGRSHKL